MNSIALKALERAQFQQMTRDMDMRTNRPKPVELPPTTQAAGIEPDTSGPINTAMYNEGRRYAIDVLNTCKDLLRSATGRDELQRKLKTAAVGRPPSIAKGICSIMEMLQEKDQ